MDEYVRVIEMAPWSGYGRVRAADFSGIMGGLVHSDGETTLWSSSSWNPVELRFLGEHSGYADSTLFGVRLHSYDEATGRDTTPDGGAYVLRMGGLSLDKGDGTQTLKGGLYGLYISPDGMEAGFLKGTGLYGTSYLDVRMWDMAGTLYRDAQYSGQESPYPISAADLLKKDPQTGAYVNLATQPMTTGPDLGGLTGICRQEEGLRSDRRIRRNGSTMSIKDSPVWGFSHRLRAGQHLQQPRRTGACPWLGGTAGFGVMGSSYADLGVWLLQASGGFLVLTARWRVVSGHS
jgi:hypothetical protein